MIKGQKETVAQNLEVLAVMIPLWDIIFTPFPIRGSSRLLQSLCLRGWRTAEREGKKKKNPGKQTEIDRKC